MNSKYMQLAIDLAKKGNGRVYTNPLVGCVVVKENEVVGRGWHKYFGGEHAEINALTDAGKSAKNADLYVTLEPCNSYGKRPPCTLAIVKAGIKRVCYALRDKNAFGSSKMLKMNGVKVYGGLLKKQVQILTKDFLNNLSSKPKVSVKVAMTLDGKIATYNYDSKWITSAKSRRLVHKMRSQYDAVLVGSNTVFRDNPFLTTHSKSLKNPIRVVIDSKLKLRDSYNLFDGSVPTIIIYDSNIVDVPKYLIKEGIILAPVDIVAAKKDFGIIIKKLNSFSIKSVLIEGGSEIIASALFSNIVDDIYIFIAPKIIGGRTAISVVCGDGVEKISKALRIKNMKVKKIDSDLLVTGQIDTKRCLQIS
ncbi:MAG: bifunctional diaminohydroxyphosphoribosylaminopyrimidine deaminase/5-amino-6-(5-phosphoribosylamino)uracil reductase RibD [Endomicrobium sp.]|jgi:diaminohydroxyphosphoribosylaminopyrimidine deaminase/5-amino-6-(5-phosphoribosylamino)uracil reductase|nr:bifunctional diaminohydroxyphosphoribosylaminopyrimidine deaminase/5-amino-6-(5-phosphoribosylamino)uracil reductase RibD [Endomicrobium sp.]